MMTRQEEGAEFWMLTKGILQDEQVDTDEAKVLKRWLEEHQRTDEFTRLIERLNQFLADGYIAPFESRNLCSAIGDVLAFLRKAVD